MSAGASSAPDVMLVQTQLGAEVQTALLGLPYEFREAVVLCDVVGLSYDEIASAAAVPVGTVRSRIHRGRKLLRDELS
jgi:RNA polymerase sigma-70 factor (ECF subfamily)